jgi:UV DNA damage endonuclease
LTTRKSIVDILNDVSYFFLMIYSLVCHHLGLQDLGYKFQTMTYKRFSSLNREDALKTLSERIWNNLEVSLHILKECDKEGWAYRFSSSIFPLLTYDKANIQLEDLPNFDLIFLKLEEMKRFLEVSGIFCSMHPDQFCSITSDRPDVVEKSIRELEFHAKFLDSIGLPKNSNCPINIHLSSIPKTKTVNEVVSQVGNVLDRLSEGVRSRLVFENNDKPNSFWNTENLYNYINRNFQVPITLDELHWNCFPDESWSYRESFEKCIKTWGDFIPRFHYSESKSEKTPRSHADYATKKPLTFGHDSIILDVELKMKD